MTRLIQCAKLSKTAEGLDFPPYPGALGKKIYAHICKEAWQAWLDRQTMFINEYRFITTDPKARAFLTAEMERFLFGEGDAPPAGYVAPNNEVK